MNFQQAEHNPPHIHALYGDDMVAIWFKDGNILEGELPTKELALVREWVNLNQTEL